LHSVQVSADLERVWMILKVKDKETAKEVISTLPYCSHFPHEIHQLIWNEY
jgi:hypothetical protein